MTAQTSVMYVANSAASLYVFRRPLIARLVKEGVRVICVCPEDTDISKLSDLGVHYVPLNMSRQGISFIENISSILSLYKIIRTFKPGIIHAFAHKAVIFCGLISLIVPGTRYYASVTGLGTVFIRDGYKYLILRCILVAFYLITLRKIERCFFQNEDDLDYFVRLHILPRRKCILTFGSGLEFNNGRFEGERSGDLVGTEEGAAWPNKLRSHRTRKKIRVLLVARPISEKGVKEFYRAAEVCVSLLPGHFDFLHAGTFGDSDDLFEWVIAEGVKLPVRQLGFVEDMYGLYRGVDVVVLPSYREGSSMALAEACACGKLILASDVPGCRNAVIPGWNGLLFEPKNPNSLVAAILAITSFDLDQVTSRSESLARARFDADIVWQKTAAAYQIEHIIGDDKRNYDW